MKLLKDVTGNYHFVCKEFVNAVQVLRVSQTQRGQNVRTVEEQDKLGATYVFQIILNICRKLLVLDSFI